MTGSAGDPAARPDLRALRRRPLFAPLAVPALGVALIVALAFSAWSLQRTTTVIVVRHAEKVLDGSADPALTQAGTERAARLAAALHATGIAAVYASATRRTQQTAAPLAAASGAPIETVDGHDVDGLVARIRAQHAGQTVLVVAHGDTVVRIVRAFGGDAPDAIPDTDYDEMFVVTVPTFGRTATLHVSRY